VIFAPRQRPHRALPGALLLGGFRPVAAAWRLCFTDAMSPLIPIIMAAQMAASPAPSATDSALKLVEVRCPDAESEEVEACAYALMKEADLRITGTLCAPGQGNCDAVETFRQNRDGLVQSYLAAAGDSVVTRILAALYALEVTRSFEDLLSELG